MDTPQPPNETRRLEALQHYAVLDTSPDTSFDEITELGAKLCETPIALLTFIDANRLWIKSKVGLDVSSISRDIAFCTHTIHQPNLFIVPDASLDPRFAGDPMVLTEPYIRFYAGIPLTTSDGFSLGTLCVMDRQPRALRPGQLQALRVLSRHVVTQLEVRRSMRAERDEALAALQLERTDLEQRTQPRTDALTLLSKNTRTTFVNSDSSRHALDLILEDRKRAHDAARDNELRFRATFEQAAVGIAHVAPNGRWLRVNQKLCNIVGYTHTELLTRTFQDITHADDLETDLAYVGQMLAGEIATYSMEKRYIHKNGSIIWINLTVALVRTDTGVPEYFISVIEDISERKKIEAAVRENELRYRTLIHLLPSAVYTCDAQGYITLYNRAAAILWGREPEIGKEIWCGSWKIFEPDGHPIPLETCPMALAIQEGRPVFGRKVVIERPDGSRRHVLPYPQPEFDANGAVIGAINILVDITEHRRAEAALKENELFFRNVLDGLLSFAGTLTPDGLLLFANKTALDTGGLTSAAVIGKSFADTYWWSWSEHVQQRLREAIRCAASGITARYDDQVRMANGHIINVDVSITPLRDANKQVTHLIASGVDITARKKAEDALRASERYLRTIINSEPECVKVLDPDGNLLEMNPAGLAMIEADDIQMVLGQSVLGIIAPEYRAQFKQLTDEVIAGSSGSLEFEIIGLKGTRRWLDTRAVPFDNAGTPCLLSITRDITARRQAEKEILRLNAELEQRVTERTQQLVATIHELESFAYSVSHDLRTPLRNIAGFSQILAEDYVDKLDGQAQDYLKRVRAAAKRMGVLIEDLLKLSRITRQEILIQSVNLSDIVKGLANELRLDAPERQVKFNITPDVIVQGDARLLEIAMNNLLGNAWKYTGRCDLARIDFAVEKKNGENVFLVRDNGAGFDMRYANKLFVAFQRMHTANEFDGTGIGLATVARIIQRHGGRIWAEAEVDKGATFFFTLPRYP